MADTARVSIHRLFVSQLYSLEVMSISLLHANATIVPGCGACREGKLEPRFETRTPRAKGTKKGIVNAPISLIRHCSYIHLDGAQAKSWVSDSPDRLADLIEQLTLPDVELE
jgi:hypothetical protein